MSWTWEIPSVLINSLSYLFVAAMGQVSNSSSESSSTKQATGRCQKQREMLFRGSKLFPQFHNHIILKPLSTGLSKSTGRRRRAGISPPSRERG